MKSHLGGDNIVALAKKGSGVKLYPIPNVPPLFKAAPQEPCALIP